MKFEKYINDIAKLIEININRINSRSFPKDFRYRMSRENIFELTFEEYEILKQIVDEISSENNYEDKFPKNFIFDNLVREVIIKSGSARFDTDFLIFFNTDNMFIFH